MELKRCPGFERDAHQEPLSAFAKNRTTRDGLQRRCRSCQSACLRRSRRRNAALGERRNERCPDGLKRCYSCPKAGREALRPTADFHYSSDSYDGFRAHCKDCVREARWTKSGIKGMSVERFDSMLAAQGGVCAIPGCGRVGSDARQLDVDHDHRTGQVRGLLCRNCNVMLGNCNDSVEVLGGLIDYLRAVHVHGDPSPE